MAGVPLNILKMKDRAPASDDILAAFERLQLSLRNAHIDPTDLAWNQQSSYEHLILDQIKNEPSSLQGRLQGEYLGLGPLQSLVDNPEVTEILVNGPHSIWYEWEGGWYGHTDVFLSDLTFRNFYHRLCAEANIQTNLDVPQADGRWRSFRICAVQHPLVQNSFQLSLRRHREAIWSFQTLQDLGWADPFQFQILHDLLRQRQNILLIGPTGSGKTAVLNACLAEISKDERVVILEDTDELRCANPLSTKLLSRWDSQKILSEVTLSDLVRLSLRLRPDRLVMGEVRGPEAKDLLMALSTGHRGSLATLHAETAQQALLRLEMLIQLGAPQWSLQAVRQLIHLSLDVIVVLKMEGRRRRLHGMWRLSSLETFGFTLEPIAERLTLER
jgi:pilus assembly protein CpaF